MNIKNFNKNKILRVIMEDPEIITLLKEKYVDDEIWKFCIEREPSLFRKMKHPSYEICMHACEVDGSNLRYIKNKFSYITINDVMVYTAVSSNPKAIIYVPKKLLSEDLKEMAFDQDPSLMIYFDTIRHEYLEKIISQKPSSIQYVEFANEDLLCKAILNDPNVCVYINKLTPKMLDILKEHYPEHYTLYFRNYML